MMVVEDYMEDAKRLTNESEASYEVREFLWGYQRSRARLRRLQDELCELRSLCESVTVDPTKEKVQSSGNKDKIGEVVARIVDKETEMLEQVEEVVDAMNSVESMLEKLDDPDEQMVLQMVYIERKGWSRIAKELSMSERTAQRLRIKAEQKLSLFVVP